MLCRRANEEGMIVADGYDLRKCIVRAVRNKKGSPNDDVVLYSLPK
jgi:hypothetical protein